MSGSFCRLQTDPSSYFGIVNKVVLFVVLSVRNVTVRLYEPEARPPTCSENLNWLLAAVKMAGMLELAFAFTLMALNTGEPPGPQNGSFEAVVLQSCATESNAVGVGVVVSLRYGPLWQVPPLLRSATLNFTVMLVPVTGGGGLGRVMPSPAKGD